MSHIFRDPTDGATARRADLLRRRRDELVMMPHAIRRVFVARRARTAASLAIALTGTAMLVVAAKPAWAAYLAKGLPGINPAVLCTGIIAMWLVGLFTYFAARAVDEHRFAVAMSKLVMPSGDVNDDVERLSHENPDQAAREMAHRLEVRSAALPVLAAGVLLPVTTLYAAEIVRAGGWPVIAKFEGMVAYHATALLACAGAGGVLAVAMTKRATRLPIVGPLLAALSLTTACAAAFTTAWLVPIALVGASAALVIRTLRVERDLLQAEDPAAGSEVFTIRGAVRKLRTSLAPLVARVKQVKPVWVLVAGLLVIAGYTAMKLSEVERGPRLSDARLSAVATTAPLPVVRPAPTIAPTGSKSTVEPVGMGRLEITLDLVDGQPIEIPSLAGITSIPPHWQAQMNLYQVEGGELVVSLIGSDRSDALSIGSQRTLSQSGCGMALQPFGLRVQGSPGHYVFFVQPSLTPANCAQEEERARER